MNPELFHTFRRKINENDLILHIFRDRFGKNKWSTICSAMDWIEVSLDGINPAILSRDNDNRASIIMITFLSCIDIMWEAIQQLHRVLFETDDIPFIDDTEIFQQTISDNDYFKTIRACFAAHPINLQRVFPDDSLNERWYASWSGGTFSHKDFSVILYSNNPAKESRFFDVSFNDISKFAEKRYAYLQVLMDKINCIINEHNEKYRKIPIAKGADTATDIDLLIDANEQRFNNDYYKYELLKIKRVFALDTQLSKKNQVALQKYKDALIEELHELRNRLQNMDLADLEAEVNDSAPADIQYPFSKLSDSVWQEAPCILFNYAVEEMRTFFKDLLDISITMSQEEIYVIACAGSYMLNNSSNL